MKLINRSGATEALRPACVRRPRGAGRRGLLVSAALAAALLAGCGSSSPGGGVAHINSSATATSTTKSTTKPSGLAFARCMRSHGVPNFADPNSQGVFTAPKGLNPKSPAVQAAAQDCKSLLPAGQTPQGQNQQAMAAALKFAACMRANGVPNYPDPTSGNGGGVSNSIAGSGVDPNSPAFKRAEKKCGSPVPGGGAAPTGSGSGQVSSGTAGG
jgi:hypothetical protein